VLFRQGGALGENAIVPLNRIGRTGRADYVITGDWSKKSQKEAARYGQASIAVAGDGTAIPPQQQWQLDPGAAYVHICSNETIGGVQFHRTPDTGAVPLVADMSSDILSRPVDVARYGLIYAGAQKNMGPSGLTIVIVREDLLGHALPVTPSAFNYQTQAAADSMYNTPPTYAIYIVGLVLKHFKALGGMPAIEAHNRAKAKVLYDYLDASSFFHNPVARADRSLMNVPFKLKDAALDAAFLQGAQARGMIQLKGHRSVGGMRASLYNAMSLEGVQALVQYMGEFEQEHG
jgi:phosphoserine aminotransferase